MSDTRYTHVNTTDDDIETFPSNKSVNPYNEEGGQATDDEKEPLYEFS
jgi:hypothetical protein